MGLFDFLKKDRINPLRGFMNMAVFSVSGVNPSTNRKKTVTVQAVDAEAAIAASGLLNPVATETGWERPTERQIAYAKRLELSIPKGATQRDVSALLTRLEEHDDGPIPSDLVLKAAENGMAMSFFTGPSQYKWMTEGYPVGGEEDG